MKLYKYILKHYGELQNDELGEIFGDLWRHLKEGTGEMNEISHRFAKWEKRWMERGL